MDRQTDGPRDRQVDRWTGIQIKSKTGVEKDRHSGGPMDRIIDYKVELKNGVSVNEGYELD